LNARTSIGYRTQNNHDAAERAAWRQLHWRERFDWRLLAAGLIVVAAFVAGLVVWMVYGM